MNVALSSDHRGFEAKEQLKSYLTSAGHQVTDFGCDGPTSCDYPDTALIGAQSVASGESDRGIFLCGTGIGMSITANKFVGVRAASCYDEVMVEMSRRHNNVNILCLPGDMIGDRPVDELVLMWLQTEFDGGRHEHRLKKISEVEESSENPSSASVESQ